MGLIGSGFAQRLGPVLQGLGAGIAAGPTFGEGVGRGLSLVPQFQEIQGRQQLRGLQAQQLQANLLESQRERQREEQLRTVLQSGGLFAGATPEQQAALAADPTLARGILQAQLKQKFAPAQATPFQAATLAEQQRQFDVNRQFKKRELDIKAAAARLKATGGDKPATAAERKIGNFATRMFQAENRIRQLGPQIESQITASSFEPIARRLRTKPQQLYRQAANQWIRAQLRKESGAVIGEDEMQAEFETYFPQPGDKPEVVQQKQAARLEILNANRAEAGRGFTATGAVNRLQDTLQLQEQAATEAAQARQKEQERIRRKMQTGQSLSSGQRARLPDGSVIEENGQFKIKVGGRFVQAVQDAQGNFAPVGTTQRRARIGFN